jgi:AraC family transcriptional regulator
MLAEISELCIAQEDGGSPTMLGAGSAPGESGFFVLNARFETGVHVSATARRHHVFFSTSDHLRYQCHLSGRALTHEPPSGSLAICPAGSDYRADVDGSGATILVAIDPSRLALAAADDLALDAQLIDRLSGFDQVLLTLLAAWRRKPRTATRTGRSFGTRSRVPSSTVCLLVIRRDSTGG